MASVLYVLVNDVAGSYCKAYDILSEVEVDRDLFFVKLNDYVKDRFKLYEYMQFCDMYDEYFKKIHGVLESTIEIKYKLKFEDHHDIHDFIERQDAWGVVTNSEVVDLTSE
jgi:hypothetical protein